MAEMAFSGVHPANPSEGGDGTTSNAKDWTYDANAIDLAHAHALRDPASAGALASAAAVNGAGSLATMGTACASVRCANATLNGSSLPHLWPLPHLLA